MLGISVNTDKASDELPHELIDLAKSQAGYEGESVTQSGRSSSFCSPKCAEKNWAVADAIRDGIAGLDF